MTRYLLSFFMLFCLIYSQPSLAAGKHKKKVTPQPAEQRTSDSRDSGVRAEPSPEPDTKPKGGLLAHLHGPKKKEAEPPPPYVPPESDLDRTFRLRDHQKLHSFYLESEKYFSFNSVPTLVKTREQEIVVSFEAASLFQLHEMDRLLVPYLRQTLDLQMTWQEEKKAPYRGISDQFDRIRDHFLMKTPFEYFTMVSLMDTLIEDSRKFPSSQQALYYIAYAGVMKEATSLLAGQLHSELRVLSTRPEFCDEISQVYQRGFHVMEHKDDVEFLEKRLIQIEKKLMILPLRHRFVSKDQLPRWQTAAESTSTLALQYYRKLKSKFNVEFNPKTGATCFPLITQLITQYEDKTGTKLE